MNTIDNFSVYASPNTIDGLNTASGGVSNSNALLVDGSNGMTADLNMQSHKIINVLNGTNPTDAAAFGQLSLIHISSPRD